MPNHVEQSDTGRTQAGIAFQPGRRPAPCYRLLLLNAAPGATGATVRSGLRSIIELLGCLRAGDVPELAGQPDKGAKASADLFRGLEHLVGFGRRLFDTDVRAQPLVQVPRPDYLSYLPVDGPFPALRWESGFVRNRGEADFALQLTSDSPAGVNCAAVEVWKLIQSQRMPFAAIASFDGFSRLDGRGWLEFHDGVSNMHSSERRNALEAPADPAWMAGGTYMAFFRLIVDLATWRETPRDQQELVIGRDKLSGAALLGTERDESGVLRPVSAQTLDDAPTDRELSDFRDPPQTTDPILEASHVHRANQTRASSLAPAGLRIFRQGYEFLDDIDEQPRLGLNFVSFQRDLAIVHQLLHLPGWLGDANFGGRVDDVDAPSLQLCTMTAGGFYAIPPRGDDFPAAEIFARG